MEIGTIMCDESVSSFLCICIMLPEYKSSPSAGPMSKSRCCNVSDWRLGGSSLPRSKTKTLLKPDFSGSWKLCKQSNNTLNKEISEILCAATNVNDDYCIGDLQALLLYSNKIEISHEKNTLLVVIDDGKQRISADCPTNTAILTGGMKQKMVTSTWKNRALSIDTIIHNETRLISTIQLSSNSQQLIVCSKLQRRGLFKPLLIKRVYESKNRYEINNDLTRNAS